jgi:hypothetical protein
MNTTVIPTIPSHYDLVVTPMRCRCCGTIENHSEFMAVSYIRPRHHSGTPVRHSVRVDAPSYYIQVRRIAAPMGHMAYCAACPDINLRHLPAPPSPAALTDLPEPTLKVGRKPTAATTPPRRKPTLEELA